MGKLQVIVGGQFGSEGKGMIAGYLASKEQNKLMAIRVAGPNAGHTVVGKRDEIWKLRHIPVAAVTNENAELRLAAGSEIDSEVVRQEIEALDRAGYRAGERLRADGQATLMAPDVREREIELKKRIGSTGKGIGAARAMRIMREAEIIEKGDWEYDQWESIVPVAAEATKWLQSGGTVQIEGTQGYGLGLHAGYYPYCTSSDCRAIDFLAMAGISPWAQYVTDFEVWVVLRTLPIRVAGNSGELYGEMTWSELEERSGGHIRAERTTVTNNIRRIGRWNPILAGEAVRANGGGGSVKVALTMIDYIWPALAEQKAESALANPDIQRFLGDRQNEIGAAIQLIGTGPNHVIDRR